MPQTACSSQCSPNFRAAMSSSTSEGCSPPQSGNLSVITPLPRSPLPRSGRQRFRCIGTQEPCYRRPPAWSELRSKRPTIGARFPHRISRRYGSLKLRLGSPPALGRAPPDLRLDTALLRGPSGSCRNAWPRHKRRSPHQLGKAVARVLPVLLLRPEALGADDKHAVLRQAPAGKAHQPRADGSRQARRTGDIEAQLDGGRNLVDVLPAGSRGAYELLAQLPLRDIDGARHAQAGASAVSSVAPSLTARRDASPAPYPTRKIKH